MTEPIVRLAVPDDEEGLMQHARLLHEENGLFSFDERKARALLNRAFSRQNGIIGVIGEVGEPEASIYLSLEQTYYSSDWQLVELWNFVQPPRQRRGGYARLLIEFAKKCSDDLRLPLSIGILSNNRVEAKARLYERMLEPAGVFFVHNRQFAGGSAWNKAVN